jgi:hypothetical protein
LLNILLLQPVLALQVLAVSRLSLCERAVQEALHLVVKLLQDREMVAVVQVAVVQPHLRQL